MTDQNQTANQSQDQNMTTTAFQILFVNKTKLADAAAASMASGKSIDYLRLTVEEKLYDIYDVGFSPSAHTLLTSEVSPSPYPRAISPGDLILSSDKHAWVVAGPGDLNEVTYKISPFVTFPDAGSATANLAQSDDSDESEDNAPEETEEEHVKNCASCSALRGRDQARVSTTLPMGEVSNPRNVEREEMQQIIKTTVGKAFADNGIQLNQNHSRRAVRSFLRLGIGLALEHGGGVSTVMQLVAEAIEKEAKTLGKPTRARTIAVMSFEEIPGKKTETENK